MLRKARVGIYDDSVTLHAQLTVHRIIKHKAIAIIGLPQSRIPAPPTHASDKVL